MYLLSRWQSFWTNLGGPGDGQKVFQKIKSAYSESHRAYHNLDHISQCLEEFDQRLHLALQPLAVELALWFHDIVYDPQTGDNVEQSAACLVAVAEEAELEEKLIAWARDLILITDHPSQPSTKDEKLVVDIDFSIWGQARSQFEEYEKAIALEYSWLPPEIFAAGRAEMLREFLERPFIYHLEELREAFEKRARENLQWAIENLEKIYQ